MALLLCPSMMCADYDHLADDVKALEAAGADIFHCDVMDGAYVPNVTMGLQDIRCIRKNTQKPVDVHLMVEEPGRYITDFAELCTCIWMPAAISSTFTRTATAMWARH